MSKKNKTEYVVDWDGQATRTKSADNFVKWLLYEVYKERRKKVKKE